MSGSTSFRFKKPINWAYAPGLTKAGADGSVGNPGSDGNAIYFIDYELNNSYNIELAQQKLENNFTLSGNSSQISEEREYHSGDIIVSNKGNCYRIEKGDDPYYTFSIKYIGKISSETANTENIKVLFLHVYRSAANGYYNNFVPNNRQVLNTENGRYTVKNRVDADIANDSATQDEVFGINGAWYKFFVITDGTPAPEIEYTVEVKFKNEKTYNFDSVVTPNYYNDHLDPTTNNNLYRFFKFNKVLEFPVVAISKEVYEMLPPESFETFGDVEPAFLSDMSMDKTHLFGNDVKQLVARKNGKIYCSKDGGCNFMEAVPSVNTVLQTHAAAGKSWPDETAEPFVPAVYSVYRNESSPTEPNINWRGGESAFFSSYSQNSVVMNIMEYILKFTEFNIIARNKNTGEIKVVSNMEVRWTTN